MTKEVTSAVAGATLICRKRAASFGRLHVAAAPFAWMHFIATKRTISTTAENIATTTTRPTEALGETLPPFSSQAPLFALGAAAGKATATRSVRWWSGEGLHRDSSSFLLDPRVGIMGREDGKSTLLAPLIRTVALLLGFAVAGGLTTPSNSAVAHSGHSLGIPFFATTLSTTRTSSCEGGGGGGDGGNKNDSPNDDNNSESSSTVFPEDCVQHDNYDGVTLQVHRLPKHLTSSAQFEKALRQAIQQWKEQDRRGVWIHMTTEFSHLIPICTKNFSFDFQFAERGRVVLTRWLPEDSESRLPLGPTHQVGIGALVLHPSDDSQMLVVQEKTGPAASFGLWKMPTGLSDPGEDIADAAVREMKEETGLDCVFDRIVCFRQAHGGMFNRSDLFFVCLVRLNPETYGPNDEIPLQPCETEIADIRWMKMEDYANQKLWQNSPVYQEMNQAMIRAARHETAVRGSGGAEGFVGKRLPVGFRRGTNTIYVSSENNSKL